MKSIGAAEGRQRRSPSTSSTARPRSSLNGAAKGIDSRRGVQQGADERVARRQAGAGRPQEGDARAADARARRCPISGPPAATGCSTRRRRRPPHAHRRLPARVAAAPRARADAGIVRGRARAARQADRGAARGGRRDASSRRIADADAARTTRSGCAFAQRLDGGAVARGGVRRAVPRRRRRAAAARPAAHAGAAAAHPGRATPTRCRRASPRCCFARRRSRCATTAR